MPGTGPKHFLCLDCGKRTIPKERLYVCRDTYSEYTEHLGKGHCDDNDVACQKCFIRYKRSLKVSDSTKDNLADTENDPDYVPSAKKSRVEAHLKSPQNIPLPILSSGNSHSTCCICKKRSPKLLTVATESRYKLFVEKGHLLLSGSRCCCNHIDNDKYFKEEALRLIKEDSIEEPKTFFNKSDILSLITHIRAIAIRNEKYRIDFDNRNTLNDIDYVTLTGITKDDFEDLCSHLSSSSLRCTKNRSSRTCIALLLVKLRTGMSNRLLSTLFNIGKSSIRRSIVSARKFLASNFTPRYVGFEHISREDVIHNHTRPLAQELFSNICQNPAILVVDGTYIYIQKSNNFKFQRRSYSMHKHRPLVKPMVIVTTTGYIVSILGPYLADSKNNDASILEHNISSNMEHMKDWLQEDDLLVVDRGFRDSLDFLNDLGLKCKMPPFLNRGQKQHPTEEANSSRLITKIRWIVESVNGRLKQWKYLQNIVPNSQIPAIGDYLRLVAALCNRYRTPLNTGSTEEDQRVAAKMKVLAASTNTLQNRVQEEQLDRRTREWKPLDGATSVVEFPTLSEEELRHITIGVYQLKLARFYASEHLSEDGDFNIMVNDEEDGMLRARIQSRHTSARSYLLWIEYNPALVTAWYCQCKVGSRVVGTCAHISAVIWYLGYARHLSGVFGVKDWSSYIEDAANMPQLVDESDSENSDPEE
ncbi:uncharacterized protein [Argopecten irradians]|uniref:uncharacterized protein n=1 Tax=Argopecten irradians TaxID=31199 RepID=UPI0037205849